MRDHLYAIYAFARAADDIADEGSLPAAARIEQLEKLRAFHCLTGYSMHL
jgi:phytoene/squalene synthetase